MRNRKPRGACYLPHQHVKHRVKPLPGILKLTSDSAVVFGATSESRDIFTNLLKTNFLDSVKSSALDQRQPLATAHTHLTQNFVLSESSRSAPVIAVASRRGIDCTPAGLTAAALTMNLSSLGPLYASAVRARDPNSSTRVSRAASPALGNSTDNNRLTNWTNLPLPLPLKIDRKDFWFALFRVVFDLLFTCDDIPFLASIFSFFLLLTHWPQFRLRFGATRTLSRHETLVYDTIDTSNPKKPFPSSFFSRFISSLAIRKFIEQTKKAAQQPIVPEKKCVCNWPRRFGLMK